MLLKIVALICIETKLAKGRSIAVPANSDPTQPVNSTDRTIILGMNQYTTAEASIFNAQTGTCLTSGNLFRHTEATF